MAAVIPPEPDDGTEVTDSDGQVWVRFGDRWYHEDVMLPWEKLVLIHGEITVPA